MLYLAANAASLIVAVLFYYPRQRLLLKTGSTSNGCRTRSMWPAPKCCSTCRWNSTNCWCWHLAEPQLAGIYAIVMRLVDLTAIPIRAFTMMLVQKMMRAPEILARLSVRAGVEGAIFAVSTLALLSLAILLHFFPGALGRNVAEAAPLVVLAILRAGTAQSGGIPGRAAVRPRPDADPRRQPGAARRGQGGAAGMAARPGRQTRTIWCWP